MKHHPIIEKMVQETNYDLGSEKPSSVRPIAKPNFGITFLYSDLPCRRSIPKPHCSDRRSARPPTHPMVVLDLTQTGVRRVRNVGQRSRVHGAGSSLPPRICSTQEYVTG
ncbi:hypothetical protein BHE74_00026423 [Ensete ventricosum]|nr:hypothetical protein BHE74_00026423 [Ensete ventricosum]